MESAKNIGYWTITGAKTNKLLIRLHLLKMEMYLKLVSTEHLNNTQKNNRKNVISILKQYRQQNNFPTRDDGPSKVRLPRFVGSNGVPCAMGFILQNTGEENLFIDISTNNNDIYVENIQSSQYDKWLFENGITKEETAAIQPGYPGTTKITYEIANPVLLWSITIAISCLILLFGLILLNRIAHRQPVRIISTILLTVVSFFLGFNITHSILKNLPYDLVETCVSEDLGYSTVLYSPAGCEKSIYPWTPRKIETTESRSINTI